MPFLPLLLALGKELLPFLKEALLEGQTFRAWIKTNWLTFAWLVNTLVLTLMVVHLSDLVQAARHREHQTATQLQSIQQPAIQLAVKYRQLKDDKARLTHEVGTLQQTTDQYEQWMRQCGLNLQTGQCPVVKAPLTPKPKPRPKPKPQPQLPDPPPAEPAKKGFMSKLRDLLRPNRDDSPDEDPK